MSAVGSNPRGKSTKSFPHWNDGPRTEMLVAELHLFVTAKYSFPLMKYVNPFKPNMLVLVLAKGPSSI
jgi:hypothetical protein